MVSDQNWSGEYDDSYSVYGRLKFRDDSGNYLSYATVTFTITLDTGEQQSYTETTSSRGNEIVDWSNLDEDDFPATITVTSVTKSGVSYNPSPAQFVWDLD